MKNAMARALSRPDDQRAGDDRLEAAGDLYSHDDYIVENVAKHDKMIESALRIARHEGICGGQTHEIVTRRVNGFLEKGSFLGSCPILRTALRGLHAAGEVTQRI